MRAAEVLRGSSGKRALLAPGAQGRLTSQTLSSSSRKCFLRPLSAIGSKLICPRTINLFPKNSLRVGASCRFFTRELQRSNSLHLSRVSEDDKNTSGYDGERVESPLVHATVSVQGLRSTMEDRHSAIAPALDDGIMSVFGVFDGHAGAHCAEYLETVLPQELMDKQNEVLAKPIHTLEQMFLELDSHFCSFADSRQMPDGSSALVAVVERNMTTGAAKTAWIANTGDSRAVIVRRSGKVKQLNRELTPYLEDEAHRIEAEGGFVQMVGNPYSPYHEGTLRVNGVLAMTRAFGDASLKPFVTAKPEITVRKLRKDDIFLVIASDGLWETVSNEEVAAHMLKLGVQIGVDRLVQLALRKGSTDNITVQAVRLNMANDHIPV